MPTIVEPTRMTRADYLAFERASEARHEFHDGVLVPMSGASPSHNLIMINLLFELRLWQRGRSPARVFGSDLRVRFEDSYVYPDALVCAETPQFEEGTFATLLNPAIVFEILSPSTSVYDRGHKADGYRRLDTLTDYLIVSQTRMAVEHWTRSETGWSAVELTRPDDAIRLASIGLELTLRRVYDEVSLPAVDA